MSANQMKSEDDLDTNAGIIAVLSLERLLVDSTSRAIRDGTTDLNIKLPALNSERQRKFVSAMLKYSADGLQKRIASAVAEFEMNPKSAAEWLGFEYEGE
jgi:hypothetical protein